MAEEENLEGKIVFKCIECRYLYENIERAEECEEWCKKHKSCNLNITKYAIKINEKGDEK